MAERVGFIGLGIMGGGMARNLLKAGFELRVWNRTASRADELVADGAIACATPAEVAAGSDIVVTCVSDTPDVIQVILGDDGVIEGARPGRGVSNGPTSPRQHGSDKWAGTQAAGRDWVGRSGQGGRTVRSRQHRGRGHGYIGGRHRARGATAGGRGGRGACAAARERRRGADTQPRCVPHCVVRGGWQG